MKQDKNINKLIQKSQSKTSPKQRKEPHIYKSTPPINKTNLNIHNYAQKTHKRDYSQLGSTNTRCHLKRITHISTVLNI